MKREKYVHLLNACIGGYLLWSGLRMVHHVIREITALIALFTDDVLHAPYEVFAHYASMGMPMVIASYLIGGIMCLVAFVKPKNRAYLFCGAAACLAGSAYLPVLAMSLGAAAGPALCDAAVELLRPLILLLGAEIWRRYASSEVGQRELKGLVRLPFLHEFRLFWNML